jgi:hypothetical protein
MTNPLSLFFVVLTRAGTEKRIRLRADSIKGMEDSTRGTVDVFTDMTGTSGESRVFSVAEDQDYILDCLREAYNQVKKETK